MKRYRKWIAISDSHGDMADKGALKAVNEFLKFWKPETRLHLGDAFDFRWLRGKADDKERLESIEEDCDAGNDLLKWFRPTHFLFGNHDHRVVKAAGSHDGKLRALAERILGDIYDVLGSECVKIPYGKRKGILKFGDYKCVHGYGAGVYAAMKHAQVYGNVMFGHIHAIDVASAARDDNAVGRAIGSLCLTDMEYNEGQINTIRQQNGFAYGLQHANGVNEVFQARPVNGSWVFASEFREVSAS